MDAPIDIVISIIENKAKELRKEYDSYPEDSKRARLIAASKIEAYESLISEFEGFKKLFN